MTGLAWNNVDTHVSPPVRRQRPKLLSFERPGAPSWGFTRPSGRPGRHPGVHPENSIAV